MSRDQDISLMNVSLSDITSYQNVKVTNDLNLGFGLGVGLASYFTFKQW